MSEALATDPLSVTVRAPAKINLSLGVGAVREDGFHPLDTVYQAISLYDDVTVTDAAAWEVRVAATGHLDVSGVPLDESNIAVGAGRLLAEHHGIARQARIEIAKGIPVAGGMAGGSADAAATLVALDRLWNLNTPDDDLLALAARLGSDVPFALVGGSAHGTGRGELVEPVADTGSWWWVVVPNGTGLATPAVYRAFDVLAEEPLPLTSEAVRAALAAGAFDALAQALRNDLEAPARSLRPDLASTRAALVAGGAAALLSGSGPTYLGLVRTAENAHGLRETLADLGIEALVAHGPVAGAHLVTYA